MIAFRRGFAPLVVLAAFTITLVFLRLTTNTESWSQAVGLGDHYGGKQEETPIDSPDKNEQTSAGEDGSASTAEGRPEEQSEEQLVRPSVSLTSPPKPTFTPGQAKPAGHNYTKILVMPRTRQENVDWVQEELPDLETAIYVANDASAPLHPPMNKGHEVMVYLTYVIDNYDSLPDIVMFMHAHRYAWHNNELFNNDAVEMINRLSLERVQREGYFNMRCHWAPGCPSWIHPGTLDRNQEKQEESMIAQSWSEIFPDEPVPLVLSQPCCSQFAVSRERILMTPKVTYEFYRDWIIRTELSDYISGRVWEYLWQVIFTGNGTYCPSQSACYCDGYGLCFGGERQFEDFYEILLKKSNLERQLKDWQSKASKIDRLREQGMLDESSDIEVPPAGQDVQLEYEIVSLERDLDLRIDQALERGKDPKARALEAGRVWKEGDGF